MYIRLKIFEKKVVGDSNKPIFRYEVNGTHAIKIMVITLIKQFSGEKISEKVSYHIEEIDRILTEEGF